jgi:hypothetical protein
MMMWLPFGLTLLKPNRLNTAQTSRPEWGFSLPNSNLDLSYVNLPMQPGIDLSLRCCFEKQFQCLLQIGARFAHGIPLTGHVHLWAKRYVAITFFFDDCSQLPFHKSSYLKTQPLLTL